MILAKEQYMYTCGKGGSKTGYAWRYRMKCDNPDCGEVFYRPVYRVYKRARDLSKKQYCNARCKATHFVGVCEHPGCDQKYTHKSMADGSADQLCSKHSVRRQTRENQQVYRKRDKDTLYDLLGNRCACCGERDPMYLEVDHVHNDGKKHREKAHPKSTSTHPRHYMAYLEDNPNGLQLLCSNCNYAKQKNGGELYRPAKFTRRQLEVAA